MLVACVAAAGPACINFDEPYDRPGTRTVPQESALSGVFWSYEPTLLNGFHLFSSKSQASSHRNRFLFRSKLDIRDGHVLPDLYYTQIRLAAVLSDTSLQESPTQAVQIIVHSDADGQRHVIPIQCHQTPTWNKVEHGRFQPCRTESRVPKSQLPAISDQSRKRTGSRPVIKSAAISHRRRSPI